MNKLEVNWREKLIELFPDVTTRTKEENDDWCQRCNGVGLVRSGNAVAGCPACCGKGVIKDRRCKCGRKIESSFYNQCDTCRRANRAEKERAQFEAATKIPYEEYQGLFLWNDRAIGKEDLEDELYSLDDPPKFIWGTKKEKVFTAIDLRDVVSRECEDGYEDMESFFDYKDADFLKAQELLDKWLLKHESTLFIYEEDHGTAVVLEKVIKELRRSGGCSK